MFTYCAESKGGGLLTIVIDTEAGLIIKPEELIRDDKDKKSEIRGRIPNFSFNIHSQILFISLNLYHLYKVIQLRNYN